MANAFIIHGAYGNPKENWFPWLKTELEKLGCRVFVPQFPTPEGQTLENWLKVFEQYKQHLDKYAVVVGHSVGVPFLLSVLERLNKPIKAAFFVAGSATLLNSSFDEINKTFVDKQFNWQRIKENCSKFYVFISDDDPYVPLDKGKFVSTNLGVPPIVMRWAGHFNERSGYTRFDLLLQKMRNEI